MSRSGHWVRQYNRPSTLADFQRDAFLTLTPGETLTRLYCTVTLRTAWFELDSNSPPVWPDSGCVTAVGVYATLGSVDDQFTPITSRSSTRWLLWEPAAWDISRVYGTIGPADTTYYFTNASFGQATISVDVKSQVALSPDSTDTMKIYIVGEMSYTSESLFQVFGWNAYMSAYVLNAT